MKEKYSNKIYGYVIMPNHIHCLIKITDESPKLSILIQNAKRFLAYQIVDLLVEDNNTEFPPRRSLLKGTATDMQTKRHSPLRRDCGEANIGLLNYFKEHAEVRKGAKHKLFEDRYDSLIIQSRKFFLEKLNYIHRNPCTEKWKLAENPEGYKYSSAPNYILGAGVYDVDVMEF